MNLYRKYSISLEGIVFFLLLSSFHVASKNYNQMVLNYLNTANQYIAEQNMPQTKIYLDSAATYIKKTDNISLHGYYSQLNGDYHSLIGDDFQAHQHYYNAINYYEEAGVKHEQNTIYYNIALFYLYKKDTTLLKHIINKMQKRTDPIDEIILYDLTARYYNCLYEKRKQPALLDSTILYSYKGIDIFEHSTNMQDQTIDIAYSYILLADNLVKKKNYNPDTLSHYIDKARQWANPLDTTMMINCYHVEGEMAYNAGNLTAAQKIFEEILLLMHRWSNKENLSIHSDLYKHLSNIAETQGDYAAALSYERQHIACLNTIHDEDKYRIINELGVKYETERKDREILFHKKVKWLYWGIYILSGVAFFFILRWTRSRRKAAHSQLQIIIMEKKEMELQKQLKEKQLKQTELEKYEALIDSHFKEMQLSEMDEVVVGLKNEQQKLIEQIREFSDKVNKYEQSKLNMPGTNIKDAYFSGLIHEIYSSIFKRLCDVAEQEEYIEALRQINDTFFIKLKKEYQGKDLSVINIKYCISFAIGMDNRHIAECLCIELESVHKARHRLRNKFNISKEMDFNFYLKQLTC